jgi:hypothetical protein
MAISFSIGNRDNYCLLEAMLVLEMVLYIFVATLILRNVDIMAPPFNPLALEKKELLKACHVEILLHREIYS